MRALVKAKREPGIWMQDLPVPEIGHNDALIRVRKAAICGTDIHIYNWDDWAQRTIPVPMAIGHEFTGEIVAVGSEVRGLKPGDRVSGEGHITCGFCRNCRAGRRHLCRNTQGVGVNRPGCFAEYVAIPAGNAFVLPDSIGDDVAAFLDPLGNATHAALSFDLVGEDVLITGAGPIGIMAAAIARHVGARHIVITDVNDYRLDLARKMGVTRAVNAARETLDDVMKELGMQEGFDVGLEMSGNPAAFRDMLRVMVHGGRCRNPRHSAGRGGDRLESGDLQGTAAQGHLWARDVRDLVQDGHDAPERSRRHAGHHASLRERRIPGSLRGDEIGPFRQGRPGLVLSSDAPSSSVAPPGRRAQRVRHQSR
jgi:threonine 3-dehydrogenase